MKCPKCGYLGFETGDRCKNCGYDFSLLSVSEFEPSEYEVHPASIDDLPIRLINDDVDDAVDDGLSIRPTPDDVLEDLRKPIEQSVSPSPVVRLMPPATGSASDPALPLFTPRPADDDEPLIKLPAAPRPPLAVRRTPDPPRLRAVARPASLPSPAPVLQFSEEPERAVPPPEATKCAPDRAAPSVATAQPGRAGVRLVALLIDYLILFGIDAAVIYFTVRMAGLSNGDWRLLPVAPMVAFLGLLKVAYFYAFTAVGGQTIGKMAVGTCVVMDNGRPVDAAGAMRRTSAGALSFLLFGLGFVPALFGDRRALHDRLAGTRVVRLRSV